MASIIDNSSDAIICKTLDGTIISWNKSAKNIYQYTDDEAIGKSISMLVPQNLVDEVPNLLSKIKSGERIEHYETVRKQRDGTLIDVSLSISPIINRRGTVIGASTISRDISKQKLREQKIRKALKSVAKHERLIHMVTDNIPSLVAYWNSDLRCEYSNRAYLEWFNKSKEQMHAISMQQLMGETLFIKNEPFIRAALLGKPQKFERTLTKADGTIGYTLARYIPDIFSGVVRGFFVLVSDVTELKNTQLELERRNQELDVLATTDPLTGIGNRRHFLHRAKEEFVRSKRYGVPMSFLMIDVDHFKSVNDAHGHDVGDEVLKALAAALRDTMRTTDQVGRLGGEEFAALLIQTDFDESRRVAERLREVLRNTCILTNSVNLCFTVSIGLAECSGDVNSVEELMKRADLALYHAKGSGRDRVCCYGEF